MLERMASIDEAGRLGLALAMAVFMGLAFEGVYKRAQHTSPGGIRTFPLLAALGALLYLLDDHYLAPFVAGLLGVALWLQAHIQRQDADHTERPSLMIPTANLMAYSFGPIALTQPPWIVIGAAVTAVLLLEGRQRLHGLAQIVAPAEVLTLGKFLILIGIVLPLLPNHAVVPWTPISPFQVWLALVAVSSVSYASYLLQRYLSLRSGALLPALLGGLYSSTATTVTLARQQREAAVARADLAAGIVLATAMMYLRVAGVIALFNAALAGAVLVPMLVLSALAALLAAWEWWRTPHASAAGPQPAPANPLQLGTALTFAMLFMAVALASTWAGAHYGQTGVYVLAGLTGLTDINPFVLSVAQGGVGDMPLPALATAILIAVASNNLLNAGYALTFGGLRNCLRPAVALLLLGLTGLAIALVRLHAAGN